MSKDLNRMFVAAIKIDDIDTATNLLDISGLSDPDTWFSLYQLLCNLRLRCPSDDILQLLLSEVDDEALTKIFMAATDCDEYRVVNLIRRERPIVKKKASEKNGNTALHIAVQQGSSKVVERLCYEVVDIDAENWEGSSALHLAAVNADEDTVYYLMDAGADCNMRDQFGRTALHIAAIHDNEEGIKQLLAFGADVNVTCDDNLTPLECKPLSGNLKRHIVAMKVLNMYVSNKNLRYVDLAGKDRASFEYYRKKIENLKTQRIIHDSDVSYYRYLTCGLNQLAAYAENKKLIFAVDLRSRCNPWYEGFIYKRMKLGEKRKGLLSRSLKSLEIAVRALFGRALPEDDIAWEITDYLSNEDLENLIKAASSRS